jgi:hypothetical protein
MGDGPGLRQQLNFLKVQVLNLQFLTYLLYIKTSHMDSYSYSSILAGATLIWYLYHLYNERKANPRRLPRPPGPKGYPIVGNMFDTPKSKAWVTYDQWFRKYGTPIFLSTGIDI